MMMMVKMCLSIKIELKAKKKRLVNCFSVWTFDLTHFFLAELTTLLSSWKTLRERLRTEPSVSAEDIQGLN